MNVNQLAKSDECANCAAYNWKQADPATLRQCSKCKVFKYCSEDCQAEHWKLIHKKHCKKLAMAKNEETADGKATSPSAISIYSHHPFPETGLPEDTTETLVALVQQILEKIKAARHPACHVYSAQLARLASSAAHNRRIIWSERKRYPAAAPVNIDLNEVNHLSVKSKKDPLGLWSTLIFVGMRLDEHMATVEVNSLKEPRKSVPSKMWNKVEKDVGVFPSRLQEIIRAFSSSKFPTFQELLKIYCGGSLVQKCSWCASNLSVAAVHAEAEGYKKNIPTVVIRPYFSPSFCCGATSCEVQMTEKFYEWNSWSMGVSGTYVKLMSTRCHFCFKHAEEVHRSFIDLTRGQTLVNCWIVTGKIGLW